jgi:predicted lipoprotein with Yx(FWY)xxD motif
MCRAATGFARIDPARRTRKRYGVGDMTMKMKHAALAGGALILAASGAFAASAVTAKNGMTLYTFDKDVGGVSACYDDCAKMWPPYMGKKADAMTEGWTLVERKDKTMQWDYDKKPVYFFEKDKMKGDMAGDGMGGMWHEIME